MTEVTGQCPSHTGDTLGRDRYSRDAPLDCWTCKNRRSYDHGPSIVGGCVVQTCKEYISLDCVTKGSRNLPCSYAYDTFCHRISYRPDMWTRIASWVRKLEKYVGD